MTAVSGVRRSQGQSTVDKDYDALLRGKREAFVRQTGTRKSVHLTLVTTNGQADTMYKGVFQSVITLDDLFQRAATRKAQ